MPRRMRRSSPHATLPQHPLQFGPRGRALHSRICFVYNYREHVFKNRSDVIVIRHLSQLNLVPLLPSDLHPEDKKDSKPNQTYQTAAIKQLHLNLSN